MEAAVMKTSNIIKVFAAAAISCAAFSSCQSLYEDYNTNHHEVSNEMLDRDNLRNGGLFRQLETSVIIFGDGKNLHSDYQIVQNLVADTYAGYTAPTIAKDGGKHTGTYYMNEQWCRAMFNYKYTGCMSAYSDLVAIEGVSDAVLALADVLKVAAMHTVTDYYGPIPYTKVGQSINAEYDSQELVYKTMFTELDNAIDVLENFILAGNTTLLEDYDYVYGGNLTSWVKFANSLRLRLAIRCAYVESALAKAEAEKSIASSIGVMDAASDYAHIDHNALVYEHPIYHINYQFNDGDCAASANVESILGGYGDPRLPVYMKAAADGKYHGVRMGVKTSNWEPYRYTAGNVSGNNIAPNADLVWMYASEVYFLRAEGALRGWNMGGTAKELYETGVKTSFEERGVSGAETYLANSTAVPADYAAPANCSGSSSASAVSKITIKFDEGATFEQNLERIITQKWIAMFPLGTEGWAEYRRTGYPKLFAPVNNDDTANCTNGAKRIPFPDTEYTNNGEEVAKAVVLIGGNDNAGVKLWWDKK